MVTGLVVMVICGLGILGLAAGTSKTSTGSSGGATTSTPATTAPVTVAPGPSLTAAVRPRFAQVVYQVADYSSGTEKTSWEVLTDSRPFSESDLDYTQNPLLGAEPASGSVSTFAADYNLSAGKLQELSTRVPSVGDADQALAVEIPDLVSHRLAEVLDQTMTVAGRTCQVVRFAAPPNGSLAELSGSDHDDLCLDRDGLILSESWTYDSKLTVQRTAVAVSVTSPLPMIKAAPPVATATPAKSSTPVVVSPGAATPAILSSPPVPSGYAAEPAQSVQVHNPSDTTAVIDSSTVWSFGSGGDLITVEAGTGQLPWQSGDTPGTALTLRGLGPATAVFTSDGPEIRVGSTSTRWVRIDGTVPSAQLVAYAESLSWGPAAG